MKKLFVLLSVSVPARQSARVSGKLRLLRGSSVRDAAEH